MAQRSVLEELETEEPAMVAERELAEFNPLVLIGGLVLVVVLLWTLIWRTLGPA